MGLISNDKIKPSYFPPGGRFSLLLSVPRQDMDELLSTLGLFARFSAIGSRCRNGWGSFLLTGPADFELPEPKAIRDLDQALDRDFPHCLGRDERGPLFWQTPQPRESWHECMRDLARIYVSLRLQFPLTGGRHRSPQDRHLLGYPLTNHPVNRRGWKNGRHASGLRLLVRKDGDKRHRGYFLHLPHLFSTAMWPEEEKQRQLRIWQKVHRKLDEECRRIDFGEVQ